MPTICSILCRIYSFYYYCRVTYRLLVWSWVGASSSLGVSSADELIRAVGQGLEVAAVGGRLNYTLRFRTSFFHVLYRRFLCVLVTQLWFWKCFFCRVVFVIILDFICFLFVILPILFSVTLEQIICLFFGYLPYAPETVPLKTKVFN